MSDHDEIDKKLENLAFSFTNDDIIAAERAKKFKEIDPFPYVPPALLNIADILDYIAVTGMICPFHPERKLLKPASYGVRLLGKCVFFDEHGEKIVTNIKKDEEFIVKKNSIAFVTLEPKFRLPNYIALRFNFKIKNVYRGLLLGTGPLVDPGFEGCLSLPIHNLTTNDYTFMGGEDLIYFEFTKISKYSECGMDYSNKKQGFYVPFPIEKLERKDVEEYLKYASPHKPVRSSIPEIIQKAAEDAGEASENAHKAAEVAEKIREKNLYGIIIGLVALALTLIGTSAAVIFSVCQNYQFIREEQTRQLSYEKEQKAQFDSLSAQIRYIKENTVFKNNESPSIQKNKK